MVVVRLRWVFAAVASVGFLWFVLCNVALWFGWGDPWTVFWASAAGPLVFGPAAAIAVWGFSRDRKRRTIDSPQQAG